MLVLTASRRKLDDWRRPVENFPAPVKREMIMRGNECERDREWNAKALREEHRVIEPTQAAFRECVLVVNSAGHDRAYGPCCLQERVARMPGLALIGVRE